MSPTRSSRRDCRSRRRSLGSGSRRPQVDRGRNTPNFVGAARALLARAPPVTSHMQRRSILLQVDRGDSDAGSWVIRRCASLEARKRLNRVQHAVAVCLAAVVVRGCSTDAARLTMSGPSSAERCARIAAAERSGDDARAAPTDSGPDGADEPCHQEGEHQYDQERRRMGMVVARRGAGAGDERERP